MKLNTCLEKFGIDRRNECLKAIEGNCQLKEIFWECSLFHDRLMGDTAQLPWSHHYRLKTAPPGFKMDEYMEKGIAELRTRKDLLTPEQ